MLGAEAAGIGVNRAVFVEAVVLQMFWPGAPTLYYGDEVGMCGFTDPDNRRPFPWGHEDQQILELHKELIRIHRTYPAARTGSFRMLHCEHGILSFGRFDREDQIFVAVNNNDTAKIVIFSVEEIGVNTPFFVSLMLTTEHTMLPEARFYSIADGKLSLTMPPFSSFVLKNFNIEAQAE